MPTSLRNLKEIDQWVEDEARTLRYHIAISNFVGRDAPLDLVRKYSRSIPSTENGEHEYRLFSMWERMYINSLDAAELDRDGDFFKGVTNGIALTAIGAMILLIVAGFCWPSLVSAWSHVIGQGAGR
jgi:hypothetical protein